MGPFVGDATFFKVLSWFFFCDDRVIIMMIIIMVTIMMIMMTIMMFFVTIVIMIILVKIFIMIDQESETLRDRFDNRWRQVQDPNSCKTGEKRTKIQKMALATKHPT